MVKVKFKGESLVKVYELYQWDYGQQLEITGLDLPEHFKMHFQIGSGEAQSVNGIFANGVGTVSIPDAAMQQDTDKFNAWVYIESADSGKTIKTVQFNLNRRERPSDTPPADSTAELKGYAEYVKENADKVAQAEQIAKDIQHKAESGVFNGKDGAQGPPGKDYTLTEADKTEIAGMVPVDAELSADSVNAIQNKAVAAWLDYAKCKGLRIIYDAETAAEYFAGAYKDALQEGEYYLVYIMNTVDLDSFACSSGLYVVTRDFQFEDNLYLPSTETLGEVFAYYEEELENVDDTADRNARYIEILAQIVYDLEDDVRELQNRMNRIENGINSIEAMIDESGVLA